MGRHYGLVLLLFAVTASLSHGPLGVDAHQEQQANATPAFDFRKNSKWKSLKRQADSTWHRARSNQDGAGVAKAHELYRRAWNESASRDYEAFWDIAYTSAVGCLLSGAHYPSRAEVSSVLHQEMDASLSADAPYGETQVSQMVAMTMLDAPDLLRVARSWAAAFRVQATASVGAADADHEVVDDEKVDSPRGVPTITVGYLSGHFDDHPVGHHIGSLLRLHDRSRFIVHCLSTSGGDDGSAFYTRNKAACDRWTEIPAETTAAAAAQHIRQQHIDVLVSLDGYDRGHRMDILALSPSRHATLHFFGFLATSGADGGYVDAIVADAVALPAHDEKWISERHVLRHPTTFFVTDYQTMHPEVMIELEKLGREVHQHATPADTGNAASTAAAAAARPLQSSPPPGAPFAFCSFSQLFKVSPLIFDAWLDILEGTGADTRLYLPDHPPVGKVNLLRHPRLVANPSLAARVHFLPLLPRNEHLLYKGRTCHLGLDTPYYNGHTSVTDLLWAGVPVLTLTAPNVTMAGRAAASLVRAAGAPPTFYAPIDVRTYVDTAVQVWAAYQRGGSAASTVTAAGEAVPAAETEAAAVDPLLWRPSRSSPLFDSQRWTAGFEHLLEKAMTLRAT